MKIVIKVSGGVVQGVVADAACDVLVLDYDGDCCDFSELTAFPEHGERNENPDAWTEYAACNYETPLVDKEYTEQLIQLAELS